MRAKHYVVPVAIVLLWAAYAGILLLHATPSIENDARNPFSAWGSFGDAFGGVASLMATLAASGAILALAEQRSSGTARDFESNFFSLLSHLQSLVTQTDVESVRYKRRRLLTSIVSTSELERVVRFEGYDAFRVILSELRDQLAVDNFSNIKVVCKIYDRLYDQWADDLGHYFRLLYHIVRLIDDKCDSERMYYSRIVRAHLSNSQIVLLAYNCVCGEGRDKFYRYLAKYSLLHNYHVRSDDFSLAELDFFKRKLGTAAFRFRDLAPVSY